MRISQIQEPDSPEANLQRTPILPYAKLNYITCFYNIGRSSWKNFSRSFKDYLKEFEPFIELFKKETKEKHHLYIYIDSMYFEEMSEYTKDVENISLNIINEQWLKTNTQWKDLEDERKVMQDSKFKDLIGNRIEYPECHIPEYTMINHIKVDLLLYTYNMYIEGDITKHFLAWVDFGFFKINHLMRGVDKYIPKRLLDYAYFNDGKIHYTLINKLDISDLDIEYTLKHAPEKVAGYFFITRADQIIVYHKLYSEVLKNFRKSGYADDDQHLVLQCYAKNPSLFSFHVMPWHTALVFFQNILSINEEFLRGLNKVNSVRRNSFSRNELLFDYDILSPKDAGSSNDKMLTLLGVGLTIIDYETLKGLYPNSKIYNIVPIFNNKNMKKNFSNSPEFEKFVIPGVVEIICQGSKSGVPNKSHFESILQKDLKFIKFDKVFTR